MAIKTDSEGTMERFEELFKRYFKRVNYYFARRGCSPQDSADLTQETFLGVYKGMESYRGDASKETWLYTIAANVWRNWLRSQAAGKRTAIEVSLDQEVEANDQPADPPHVNNPLDRALAGEQGRLFRKELEELPPRMRDCLLLRVDQGLKYREIAAIMGTSVETVKSQLHQARERLKESLGNYFTIIELED